MNNKNTIYRGDKKPKNHHADYCIVRNGITEEEICELFHLYYQKRVLIRTIDREYRTFLYQKNDKELITIQNDRIPICDVLSIELIDESL